LRGGWTRVNSESREGCHCLWCVRRGWVVACAECAWAGAPPEASRVSKVEFPSKGIGNSKRTRRVFIRNSGPRMRTSSVASRAAHGLNGHTARATSEVLESWTPSRRSDEGSVKSLTPRAPPTLKKSKTGVRRFSSPSIYRCLGTKTLYRSYLAFRAAIGDRQAVSWTFKARLRYRTSLSPTLPVVHVRRRVLLSSHCAVHTAVTLLPRVAPPRGELGG